MHTRPEDQNFALRRSIQDYRFFISKIAEALGEPVGVNLIEVARTQRQDLEEALEVARYFERTLREIRALMLDLDDRTSLAQAQTLIEAALVNSGALN